MTTITTIITTTVAIRGRNLVPLLIDFRVRVLSFCGGVPPPLEYTRIRCRYRGRYRYPELRVSVQWSRPAGKWGALLLLSVTIGPERDGRGMSLSVSIGRFE